MMSNRRNVGSRSGAAQAQFWSGMSNEVMQQTRRFV
jgi:hypothetical protein